MLSRSRFMRFSWHIPSDAPEGLYKLKVEFDNWDIDASQEVRWFNVGTIPADTTPQNTTFNIPLIEGWNLISIPLEQDNWSITSVLSSIEGNYTVVYAYMDGAWKSTTARRNPLAEMTPEYGYWIYMNASDTLELTGTAPSTPTTINLNEEWNLVGYPSSNTQNLTEVLSGINYTVVYAYMDGAWKSTTARRNPLTNMTSGYGHWIYANEAGAMMLIISKAGRWFNVD